MTTTVTVTYTVGADGLILASGRSMNIPAGNAMNDLELRDPVAWTAIQEFSNLGTTSGTVTITAVA